MTHWCAQQRQPNYHSLYTFLLFLLRFHFNVVVVPLSRSVPLTCKDRHLTDFDGPLHSSQLERNSSSRQRRRRSKGKNKNAMSFAGARQTELWLLYWINTLLNTHRRRHIIYIDGVCISVRPSFLRVQMIFDVELVRTYTHASQLTFMWQCVVFLPETRHDV